MSLSKTFIDQPYITFANAFNLHNIADTYNEVIRSHKSKAAKRNVWIIYILLQKVDPKTCEDWDQYPSKDDFLSFKQHMQFLNDRCVSPELYNENECNDVFFRHLLLLPILNVFCVNCSNLFFNNLIKLRIRDKKKSLERINYISMV